MIKILTFILLFSTLVSNAQTYVTKQDVNFREGAGIKYQSLGVIPVGEKIQVLESSGKWTKIYYRGTEGYISSKFISSNNGEATNNDSNTFSNPGTFKIILFVLGLVFFQFSVRYILMITYEILNVDSGVGYKLKYRCLNCGKRSTRRGHVYKCNNASQHQWFEV
jgi:uncharacterized protein YgiM (DUF1202 family)